MKIVKWSNRKIKIYFNEKKVQELTEKRKYYVFGFLDKQEDIIYIRSKMSLGATRRCIWHELFHILFLSMGTLDDESLVETCARFTNEIFDRNKWIRELYK